MQSKQTLIKVTQAIMEIDDRNKKSDNTSVSASTTRQISKSSEEIKTKFSIKNYYNN